MICLLELYVVAAQKIKWMMKITFVKFSHESFFSSITSISNGTIFNEEILNITFSHKGCQMQLLLMLKKMSKTQMANFIPPFLTPIRSRLVKANNRPCPTVTQNNSLFFCPDFNTWTVRQKFVFPDNLEMVSMQPTADFEIWSKYKVVINGIF